MKERCQLVPSYWCDLLKRMMETPQEWLRIGNVYGDRELWMRLLVEQMVWGGERADDMARTRELSRTWIKFKQLTDLLSWFALDFLLLISFLIWSTLSPYGGTWVLCCVGKPYRLHLASLYEKLRQWRASFYAKPENSMSSSSRLWLMVGLQSSLCSSWWCVILWEIFGRER